jgi:oligogalacturonide lyase
MLWRKMLQVVSGILLFAPSGYAQTPIPDEFVDPETHLRVLHLSRIPNDRSGVIYFTYPSFTQDSRFGLIDTQFDDKWRHLYSFDFQRQSVQPLVTDRLTQDQVVAPASGNLYYLADNAAWVIDIRGGTPRKIANLPARWCPGAGFSVNADETFIACASTEDEIKKPSTLPTGGTQTFAQHRPNILFTINIKTGEVEIIYRINTWLGHVQFSPTDPDLLMMCHEGPWEKVDRIWMIRLSKPEPYLIYKRTEPPEIVGHEFWGADGKTIWFQQDFRDLKTEYLSGLNLETKKLTQYPIPPGGHAIHYTWAPDGSFLVGDGTNKLEAAQIDTPNDNDKYLSLLVAEGDKLKVIHVVTLKKNDYKIEPNPHVSPDNRWISFTATLFGTPQAYAVELPPQWRHH